MKMVLSTMTNAQIVCFTAKGSNGQVICNKKIKINGGANLADRKTLITPHGVITELSDYDFAELIATDIYKGWLAAGLIKPVVSAHAADDVEKEGMAVGDNAMPYTAEDLEGVKSAVGGNFDDDGETDAETEKPRPRRGRKAKK